MSEYDSNPTLFVRNGSNPMVDRGSTAVSADNARQRPFLHRFAPQHAVDRAVQVPHRLFRPAPGRFRGAYRLHLLGRPLYLAKQYSLERSRGAKDHATGAARRACHDHAGVSAVTATLFRYGADGALDRGHRAYAARRQFGAGRRPNATAHRSFSSIIYLNDGYEGGETYFPGFGMRIKPEPGLMVLFGSGPEYVHGVTKMRSGRRSTYAGWFTFTVA